MEFATPRRLDSHLLPNSDLHRVAAGERGYHRTRTILIEEGYRLVVSRGGRTYRL